MSTRRRALGVPARSSVATSPEVLVGLLANAIAGWWWLDHTRGALERTFGEEFRTYARQAPRYLAAPSLPGLA